MSISVSNWVWRHSNSRHGARLVLLALADHGEMSWPSIAAICDKANLGERAVHTAIADLVKLGELEVLYNAGPHGCNRYRIIMHTPADSAPPQILHPLDSAPPQNLRGQESSQVNTPTPADSAPPADIAGVQILQSGGADSAPGTVIEPSTTTGVQVVEGGSGGETTTGRPRKDAAQRLPDNFHVTAEMVEWKRANTPHVDGKRETEKFIDHWRSASGANARKRDWVAAWRNWMRKADDDLGRRGSGRPAARKPSIGDRALVEAEELKAQLRSQRKELP